MKKVIIVRNAMAFRKPGNEPLSERGKQKTEELAQRLLSGTSALSVFVVHASGRAAADTAEIFIRVSGCGPAHVVHSLKSETNALAKIEIAAEDNMPGNDIVIIILQDDETMMRVISLFWYALTHEWKDPELNMGLPGATIIDWEHRSIEQV